MKISCDIIKDLLPSYAEHLTSEASNQMIQNHLSECKSCSALLSELTTPIVSEKKDILPLRSMKKELRFRKYLAVLFTSSIVALLLFITFSYLSKPYAVSYSQSGIKVTKSADATTYVDFSKKVTACHLTTYSDENGQTVAQIEAWTSLWDRLLSKSTPSLKLPASDVVFYCDYTTSPNNMVLISGVDQNQEEGTILLKRLFLGYYFIIALILTVILGILWLIFRKKKSAKIFRLCFFLPLSYLIAHQLLDCNFSSFFATRDFVMNVIATIMIYCILVCGSYLYHQHVNDRQMA